MIYQMRENCSFFYKNFDILNSKNILRVVAITNSVKKFLTRELKVDKKKKIIPRLSLILNLKL